MAAIDSLLTRLWPRTGARQLRHEISRGGSSHPYRALGGWFAVSTSSRALRTNAPSTDERVLEARSLDLRSGGLVAAAIAIDDEFLWQLIGPVQSSQGQ